MDESNSSSGHSGDVRDAWPIGSEATAAHYDRHLGPIYGWMLGGVDGVTERARGELRDFEIETRAGGLAVDLGAGNGAHAVPLAEMGYSVLAIDGCAHLVDELRSRANGLDLTAIRADLLAFRRHLARPADLIVCMGDTLTHLPSQDSVSDLLTDAAAALAPGGVFLATFRDYVSTAPGGANRFIPVRSDEERILTCFLEYGPEIVTVHDLVHERVENAWRLRVSSYPKLRLDPNRVAQSLASAGCVVEARTTPAGMIGIRATLPVGAPT